MRRAVVLGLMAVIVAALLLGVSVLRGNGTAPSAPSQPEATAGPAFELIYERPLSQLLDIEVTLSGGETYKVNPCMAFDESGRMLGVYSSLGQPLTVEGREDFALDPTAYQMLLLLIIQ